MKDVVTLSETERADVGLSVAVCPCSVVPIVEIISLVEAAVEIMSDVLD